MRHPVAQLVLNEARQLLVLLRGSHFDVVHAPTGKLMATTAPASDAPRPEGCLRIADGHADRIVAAAFSRDGALLATTADDKWIRVWDTNEWTCNWRRRSGKRPTALAFTPDAAQIVIADKFGDVTAVPLTAATSQQPQAQTNKKQADDDDEEDGIKPILGHLSLITDMALTPSGTYVITSDRDEKVRVSRFPKGHLIHSYCLGHTQFVTRIHLPAAAPTLLLSGGGDALLILWDYLTGTLLQKYDLCSLALAANVELSAAAASEAREADVHAIVSDSAGNVATALENVGAVFLFKLEGKSLQPTRTLLPPASTPRAKPTALAFTAPGTLVVAWDAADSLVTAYDVATGEPVAQPVADAINEHCQLEVPEVGELFMYRQLRKFAKSTNRMQRGDGDDATAANEDDGADSRPNKRRAP